MALKLSLITKEQVETLNPELGFLEYLAEGVLILDSQRQIRGVNSALQRSLGWTAEELLGRSCQQFFGCQHPATATPMCANLCPLLNMMPRDGTGANLSYQEVSIQTKHGSRREFSISFSPLELPLMMNASAQGGNQTETTEYKSQAPLYIAVLRDITEQKRQERIKVEFITTASHQLRTPLASIKTAISLLLSSLGADFNPALYRLLHNIQNSSARMERLVNDLIELNNLQNGRVTMHRRPISVVAMIDNAVESVRERLEVKSQTLMLEVPREAVYVETDFLHTSRVLQHLLSNASKFSPAGSPIYLSVSLPDKTSDSPARQAEVIFSVRDEGIGIAEEEKPFIFEKFYQAQISENSEETGSGLGLPLARALIELNNGRLWFESRLGQGSRFSFSLPQAHVQTQLPANHNSA